MNRNTARSNIISDQIGDSRPESIAKPQLELNPRMNAAINDLARQMPSGRTHVGGANPVSLLNPDEISYIQAYLEQVKVRKINSTAQQNNTKYCLTVSSDKVACNPGQPINTWKSPVQGMDRSTNVLRPSDVGIDRSAINTRMDPVSREVPLPIGRAQSGSRDTSGCNRNLPTRQENLTNQNFTQYRNTYHNPYEIGSRQNEFGSLYKPTYTGPYNNSPDLLDEMGLSSSLYEETFPGDIRNVNLESSLLQREATHFPGQRELTERELNRFELLPYDPQDTRHIIWKDNMPRGGYPTRVDRLETL